MVKWFIITFIIIITKLILGDLNKYKRKDIFLFVSFIAIVIGLTLRKANMDLPSGDLDYYYRTYNSAIYSNFNVFIKTKNMETGYLLLNRFLAYIFPFPRFIFFFQGAFVTGSFFYIIRKYSPNVFLSLFLYLSLGLFVFCYTGFRQSIAISICMLSIPLLLNKKYFWCLIMTGIAYLFHHTAIIFLLFILLHNLKISKRNIIIYLLVIFVISILTPTLIKIGNDFFNKDYKVNDGFSWTSGLLTLALYLFCIVLYLLYVKKDVSKVEIVFWNLSMIALTMFMGRYSTKILERMSFYFVLGFSFILPFALQNIKNKTVSDFLILTTEILSVLLFVYKTLNNIVV